MTETPVPDCFSNELRIGKSEDYPVDLVGDNNIVERFRQCAQSIGQKYPEEKNRARKLLLDFDLNVEPVRRQDPGNPEVQ